VPKAAVSHFSDFETNPTGTGFVTIEQPAFPESRVFLTAQHHTSILRNYPGEKNNEKIRKKRQESDS
jgi:hypothetical protein